MLFGSWQKLHISKLKLGNYAGCFGKKTGAHWLFFFCLLSIFNEVFISSKLSQVLGFFNSRTCPPVQAQAGFTKTITLTNYYAPAWPNFHIEEDYGIQFRKGLLFIANQHQDRVKNICTLRAYDTLPSCSRPNRPQ